MSRWGTTWRLTKRWPWPWPDEEGVPPGTPGPLPDWYPRDAVLEAFVEAACHLPRGAAAGWGEGPLPADLMERGIVMELRVRGTGGAGADIAVTDPDRLPDRQRAVHDVAMGVLGEAWLAGWDAASAADPRAR